MRYQALSIDTSIFESHGLRLESGLLKRLEQFKDGELPLLMSEVVLTELLIHMERKVRETRVGISKALRNASDHLIIPQNEVQYCRNILISNKSDREVAKERLDIFMDRVGAQLIPFQEGIDARRLMQNYFSGSPPFESTGKKKNEFPDAVALSNIEDWASRENSKVLVVSTDSDWKRFAEESSYIDFEEDLSKAIAEFQVHYKARDFCKRLRAKIFDSEYKFILEAIESKLKERVSEWQITPDATSQYYLGIEDVEMQYVSFELNEWSDDEAILWLIESNDNKVDVEFSVNIVAKATCNFELSVKDSIDREYITLDVVQAERDVTHDTGVLVSFEGSFSSDGELRVKDVEILEELDHLDFGEIEPDWWDEREH